jgi:hypothetical protein
MQPTDFVVKADTALTLEDFALSPLWAGYYEPDDVTEIVRWGVSEGRVRAALDAVRWQDDHYFPLPLEAANTKWMRGKLFAVVATTASGTTLSGYVGERQNFAAVFFRGARYVLSEHTPQEAERLAKALCEPSVFPLALVNRVNGEAWRLVV